MIRRVLKRAASTYDYDLTVIGAGPGGYVAAIKAAQLGLKTACIEKRSTLGGTCLNEGCIPAKALLNSSHKYTDATTRFRQLGIQFSEASVDFTQMMNTKQQAVSGLTKGIEGLFKKNQVTHICGEASFHDPHTLKIDEKDHVRSKNIIVASGSSPAPLPGDVLPIDEQRVLSSRGAMELREVPNSMLVVGAGVIGLELGSVYSRLGTQVTVLESFARIAPALDTEIAQNLQKLLKKQGLSFKLNTRVVRGEVSSSGVELHVQNNEGPEVLKAEYVLLAVGRSPYTKGLHLDYIDVSRDKQGRINVNGNLQTLKYDHIYAIGDCVAGPMLAHKAEEEGIFAVEHMTKTGGHLNYAAIPSVIYTMPEVAQVGKTEEELKEAHVPYTKGIFPFMANSRARANYDSEGFVKVLAHRETNELLGCHIIGSTAGELIMEAVLGLEYGAACEDIARTCHAHPCYSEAMKEACLATFAKTINF